MKIVLMVMGFVAASVGVIGTLDWDSKAAELVRWCIGAMFLLLVMSSLGGCALIHACRDGLCR